MDAVGATFSSAGASVLASGEDVEPMPVVGRSGGTSRTRTSVQMVTARAAIRASRPERSLRLTLRPCPEKIAARL
jgi:hypothetical protein